MEGIFMTFKECDKLKIIEKVCNKRLTQKLAAENLGLCIRQIKRLCQKYRLYGPKGLISKKRGVKSNNYISDEIKQKALSIIKKKYYDFGPTFAYEKLSELHKFKASVTTIRNLMIKNNIWSPHKIRKIKIHQLRTRRSREGELVQIDGSPDDWFEGRAPRCTLLAQVDDATSKIKFAMFFEQETTWNYMDLTRVYIEKYGKPLAFYSDKHAVFKINHPNAISGNNITQFHRALNELEIELICANSPQAKGRIERANRTLQDRLKKELRLRKISSMKDANTFLPFFIEDYNQRFGRAPKDTSDAHRSLSKQDNLNQILVIKENRHLSKNLTFQYKNKIYQIKTDKASYSLTKANVTVLENKKEEISIQYKGKNLSYSIYEERPYQAEVCSSKDINLKVDKLHRYKPSKYHPWRSCYSKKANNDLYI